MIKYGSVKKFLILIWVFVGIIYSNEMLENMASAHNSDSYIISNEIKYYSNDTIIEIYEEYIKTKTELSHLEHKAHNGEHGEIDYSKLTTREITINITIIVILTAFAGLMSGLTVGYLSIDELVLELRTIGGNDEEKVSGLIIQDVLSDRHRLLVTLLLSNAFAMETLPIFLHKLVPEWAAILISTILVLFIGEVIPQAYCTGPEQLKVAAACAPFTRNLIWVLSVFNIPLGKMLDSIL